MTKKKKTTLFIAMIATVVLLATASVAVVFAYTTWVEYHYNVQTYADILQVSNTGGVVTVTRANPTLKATKADIVLTSSAQNTTLGGVSAQYTEQRAPNVYRHVFTNLTLTGTNTTFICSDVSASSLYAAVAEAVYIDGSAKQVTYINEYVASVRELELLNLQSNYNNIFELAGKYYSKVVQDRVVYLIGDVTLSDSLTVNYPCSIHLLDSALVLDADLTIAHSYAGRYFVAQSSASNQISGLGKLTVKTPKAYYDINIDAATKSAMVSGSRLIEYYDYASYGVLILDDALDFAASLIPSYIYQDLTLQQYYQTYGIKLDFEIMDGGLVPLTGRVVQYGDPYYNMQGSLVRLAATTAQTIKITASRDGVSKSLDIQVAVVGTSAQALSEAFLEAILDDVMVDNTNIFSDLNLLTVIQSVYIASGYTGDLTVEVFEGTSGLAATDENAVKLMLNNHIAGTFTLDYSGMGVNGDGYPQVSLMFGAEMVTSFYLRRGTVVLSDALTLVLSTQDLFGNGNSSLAVNLAVSSQAEVMYYLRSSAAAFTTNKPYAVLNLVNTASISDGMYLGSLRLTSSTLGIVSIDSAFVQVTGTMVTDYTAWTDYFIKNPANHTILIKPDAYILGMPNNLYLQYSVVFADGSEDEFRVHVYRTLAGNDGENQQFESSNPFDQLFISTDTVWLEGGTFDVPSTSENMYARIEIITVGGVAYSQTNAMCMIRPNPNPSPAIPPYGDVSNGVDYVTGSIPGRVGLHVFYKRINFVTVLDYVPDYNTPVKVRCYYYNSTKMDVTLTQDYTIIIPGAFKCYKGVAQLSGATPFVFSGSNSANFYNMTIQLFEQEYGEGAKAYLSEIKNAFNSATGAFEPCTPFKVLHSDSEYARFEMDYSSLGYTGSAIDTAGINRLKNVESLIFDGIGITNMSAFGLMSDSALKNLSAAGCGLGGGSSLYVNTGATQSYLYDIFLETVNLSGNAIVRTDNLLARTVRELNLSSQTGGSLKDIAGLSSIKDLEVLDISNNDIRRFEVLKEFTKLETVYLYLNGVTGAFTTYGTNGEINIPIYVWLILTSGTKIYANAGNLTTSGILVIDKTALAQVFSAGGKITDSMLEGSVALNAFVSPMRLYVGGVAQLESDVVNLTVNIPGGTGGVNQGGTSSYVFRFFDINAPSVPSSTLVLMLNYVKVNSGSGLVPGTVIAPVRCSYILTVSKNSQVIAKKEFVITVHFNY